MSSIVSIENLSKRYDSGFEALKSVNLEIQEGEILALLGPNGAGKTTLISIICGLVNPSSGAVRVGGFDVVKDFREARSLIGLVPQEIALEPFQTVYDALRFTRGLFGKRHDAGLLKSILEKLSLWDKKDAKTMELSGGMKRRVLIAKALCHEPRVLFLDEPTAGVDVELRKEMWEVVRQLKEDGVTIILTTHYIDEAEAIADRVGVIRNGELLLVEKKEALMQRMGQRQMRIELIKPLDAIPEALARYNLDYSAEDRTLTYSYEANGERTGIASLFADLSKAGIVLRDVETRQSSLEDIFVGLVEDKS
ncbi:MAG: ABC transporter ATP-binding protein [Hoeflea sp.]|uniref:ABC transporter ATP-binding protein n=1 Tax=Hoeflea sp. TaxID=1940281 RepID=UPI001DB165F8|nr:ABC transporter ATP-binding protein [Hoeflea sp.]MBU4527274.1 ABC transporter ATP-binding protein [Alphaproteobacteria bacterium]MBU4546943.1 ABC transporter ATP-binding protein [Alphaproteobacteria bacterium]MBU4551545.1 ABC transporter ATP-binding protein [Alphaproteobacteria bacterium]MBV1725550.1 ABC transporter ATP-binding protein [Hoeflea sp.]MBV1759598.1 ABC transporter ATP-binding protein [Hoeflea sp.]